MASTGDDEFITRFYQYPAVSRSELQQKLKPLSKHQDHIANLDLQYCFYVVSSAPLSGEEHRQIEWLIDPSARDASKEHIKHDSHFANIIEDSREIVVFEIGPRLNFCTPFSTNAVSIVRSSCGPSCSVHRIERSIIYKVALQIAPSQLTITLEDYVLNVLSEHLYDRMVETVYLEPIKSFKAPLVDENPPEQQDKDILPTNEVDILGHGAEALRSLSTKLGLYFDQWDIAFYVNLFTNIIKRNPTVVECFDLAQSNSEHSRHWFFKGILDIEGRGVVGRSLMDMVSDTQNNSNNNNVIKFADNSSAIRGFQQLNILQPHNSTEASKMEIKPDQTRHIIFTAETHNFPTGVAPFPGAATGTGGRIRDCQATGRGAHVIAGTAGYSFGNLLLDDYDLPWENQSEAYPNNLATPARIAIEASNGASDYGNKFGEPIISGFARSFGMRIPALDGDDSQLGERWEYLKPIMFTGGIGSIDDKYIKKVRPEKDMKVAKIGGPVYRIGIGGGAASSANIINESSAQVDQTNFNAVQRGDPEMEQKLNCLIRACIEYNGNSLADELDAAATTGDFNPILSIHDQGAGGNGNVLKEIVEPNGAVIDANRFTLGDPTINILELWVAEYQESDAILTGSHDVHEQLLKKISKREKVNVDIVGRVGDDEQIKLLNLTKDQTAKMYPIDLKLDYVIGSMPRKLFNLKDYNKSPKGFKDSLTLSLANTSASTSKCFLLHQVLERVVKLPSVASKRYLTTKVDRCVTGLIAGQQCLGPLHTAIGDYALISLSHYDYRGSVTSIGEQPIKGLLSPKANAQMSVAEALTNMMFCAITCLEDVKCSANWMWAAKLPGEGAKLVDCCEALCQLMSELGIAIDGGKDSLSMMATVDKNRSSQIKRQLSSSKPKGDQSAQEIVKSPGTLVISAYAPVPDIRCKVSPVMECLPTSRLIWLSMSHSSGSDSSIYKPRLGGSALAQSFGQLGDDEAPQIDNAQLLKNGFNLVQMLIKDGICTAGHDISDGGLLVCLLEMALASHCGLDCDFKRDGLLKNVDEHLTIVECIRYMFAEECGVIIEVDTNKMPMHDILAECQKFNLSAQDIGKGYFHCSEQQLKVRLFNQLVVDYPNNHTIRQHWEETSKRLDLLQANEFCVHQEYDDMNHRPSKPKWNLTFDPNSQKLLQMNQEHHYLTPKPQVAVIREEGINGDREMMASLSLAGFDVFDVTVTDLTGERGLTLRPFKGLVFPGGFSFADVFGSGRGWAAVMKFNSNLNKELLEFKKRPDTFSLGVCNGCQLMALLGFLDHQTDDQSVDTSVRLRKNDSGRFECRFVNVRIESHTNSIMLKDMQGSCFGVWVAHGEGKFEIGSEDDRREEEKEDERVAMRYVDDYGKPTLRYPQNPNGSKWAIAGMCSKDGRHLAMMPHPERCTQMWQWPYILPDWKNNIQISPWNKIFVNAFEFCT